MEQLLVIVGDQASFIRANTANASKLLSAVISKYQGGIHGTVERKSILMKVVEKCHGADTDSVHRGRQNHTTTKLNLTL